MAGRIAAAQSSEHGTPRKGIIHTILDLAHYTRYWTDDIFATSLTIHDNWFFLARFAIAQMHVCIYIFTTGRGAGRII